jgi:hypothetical protein
MINRPYSPFQPLRQAGNSLNLSTRQLFALRRLIESEMQSKRRTKLNLFLRLCDVVIDVETMNVLSETHEAIVLEIETRYNYPDPPKKQ